ncbi:Na(+)/H(+) antiporter NhaA 2 [Kitasatospora herbaricolor]|uniref:Na+/H+ antiporter NhaA n=1 Tax=Kitasatospora herbaricolor TaxID=68217 RepID=UPI0017498F52|nr:Na+/H+ antiporter NhaA [Kitasatospora herbaricolor]MDQ0306321.1 Na+/H+ antiporter NhaA [Kitasatospora herbaricolor]GGV40335.1 Na(+)/H(+) antiporter NhaA 2 [Kitasatospora herbaricolor]
MAPTDDHSLSGQSIGESEGEARTARWEFMRTEAGSAAVLLVATIAALIWANAAPGSYRAFWETHLAIDLGGHGVALDLREWVNSGLMTLFFFVVGLEARREFDMGELRERRHLTLPLLAGLSGMLAPVAIYLAVNAGQSSTHGWGAAMSTDTAFALGMLALLGNRLPGRLRTFILTVAVVDDFVALGVIAVFYSDRIVLPALLVAAGVLVLVLLMRAQGVRSGAAYAVLGAVAWVALLKSGVDPVVIGLLLGLLTLAYPATRDDLERASGLFRSFREQPTPELERSARRGIASAISPNERLQRAIHPWSSYVIVPLFALANAGITLDADLLGRAATSPITLGILLGYLLGKPLGIVGVSWLATRMSGGRTRPPIGWGSVAAGGTIAGVGFTVSLLIATLAFAGDQLDEAKAGVLAAVLCAFTATWLISWVLGRLPQPLRARALLGTAEGIVDLATPVDPAYDHVRGPFDAPVTVVEYGDFECPYCGQAEPVVRDLLADFGDVRYVWRHLPLTDVHPHAQLAAVAAEAAAEQGAFWAVRDLLLERQDALKPRDLLRYADELGLDVERFREALRADRGAERVARDVESADLSGVSGTPTFFINGRRHHGAYDIATLSAAVRSAKDRTTARRGRREER